MEIERGLATGVPACEVLRFIVEQFHVLPGNASGFGGHGRIDENPQIVQAAFAAEAVKVVQDFLGTADRERRHDHIASLQGALDDLDQFALACCHVLVRAVAIGGFDDQDVRVIDGCRIAQNRASRLAKVAAEHDLGRLRGFADPDLDDGRSEDVPRVAEAAAHPGMRRQFLVIGDGPHLAQAVLGIFHRVQRGQQRDLVLCRPSVTSSPLDVAFLDVRAVGQHHLEQIGGCGGHVDRPLEARAGELGQQAAVVDVRMRQQHEVD